MRAGIEWNIKRYPNVPDIPRGHVWKDHGVEPIPPRGGARLWKGALNPVSQQGESGARAPSGEIAS